MVSKLVIMGVSGCGKSSVGHALADALHWPLVEGDDFHSEANRDKMRRGVALTDDDRASWLGALAEQLRSRPDGVVLTCSALKRAYREQLRNAAPRLGFVFLDIDRGEAQRRVAGRKQHFFSPALVDSQFAALESPVGEAGVLRLDATAPLGELQRAVVAWVQPHNKEAA